MEQKLTKRYNIELNMWEVGYYVGTSFYIIRYEPLSEAG